MYNKKRTRRKNNSDRYEVFANNFSRPLTKLCVHQTLIGNWLYQRGKLKGVQPCQVTLLKFRSTK